MTQEIWKPVVGYEGLYEVSNIGNIFSCRRGLLLNKTITRLGYRRNVLVNKLGVRKNIFLHRIVAEAFIENPNKYSIVMHLDNNPINCNSNNLKWGTQKENILHMYRTQYTMKLGARKNVKQLSIDGLFIKEWESISIASRTLGINQGNISSNIKGLHGHTHAGGFIWRV